MLEWKIQKYPRDKNTITPAEKYKDSTAKLFKAGRLGIHTTFSLLARLYRLHHACQIKKGCPFCLPWQTNQLKTCGHCFVATVW
jgi:hypothetical protein